MAIIENHRVRITRHIKLNKITINKGAKGTVISVVKGGVLVELIENNSACMNVAHIIVYVKLGEYEGCR